VTAFDLIEHVERDDLVDRRGLPRPPPRGVALIAVPAHPFLLGEHDDALHHKRRYTWKQFDGLVRSGNWLRRRMTWTFANDIAGGGSGSIASEDSFHQPRIQPQTPISISPCLNRALLRWHQLENKWTESHDLPFGLSILTVREKK
jgi:hypothetical protein